MTRAEGASRESKRSCSLQSLQGLLGSLIAELISAVGRFPSRCGIPWRCFVVSGTILRDVLILSVLEPWPSARGVALEDNCWAQLVNGLI